MAAMQTESSPVADVLKNPSTPGWGAIAGVIGLFLAQVTGVTPNAGGPTAHDTRLAEQLNDHSTRIERNWVQINQDRENVNTRTDQLDGRLDAVERSSDRALDRMEALKAAVDALSASSYGLTEQMRQLAQVVAVMDNRVATIAQGIGKRGQTDGQP